jgi:hypothetical protein
MPWTGWSVSGTNSSNLMLPLSLTAQPVVATSLAIPPSRSASGPNSTPPFGCPPLKIIYNRDDDRFTNVTKTYL